MNEAYDVVGLGTGAAGLVAALAADLTSRCDRFPATRPGSTNSGMTASATRLSCHDSQNIAVITRTRFSSTDSDSDSSAPTTRCVSSMSSMDTSAPVGSW